MVAGTFASLEGFADLERTLTELPKATGKNVLRKVAKGALEPMANDAAEHAPHRSGRLAYSIAISEKRTSRARWQAGAFRASASTGILMSMGPASGLGTLQYASFDEFGTVDTPAFGFMRGAWDRGAVRAMEYVKVNLRITIEAAALRLARKRARVAARGGL